MLSFFFFPYSLKSSISQTFLALQFKRWVSFDPGLLRRIQTAAALKGIAEIAGGFKMNPTGCVGQT